MRKFRSFAVPVLAVALIAGAGCSGDSPTDPGVIPVISQLQVQAAQRLAGNTGFVGFSFEYADPDGDIDRFVFNVAGGSFVTKPLEGAGQPAGRVAVQQAMDMPAAGSEVTFTVSVLDRRNNRSNSLNGTFVAP